MTAFDDWLAFAWRPDFDGQPFHVTDHDTGKGTAWGVIEETWEAARDLYLVHGELANAPQAACRAVLEVMFWGQCRCDAMHPAVAGIVFNMAMADGPSRAVKLLQAAVGAEPIDGLAGPVTLKKVNAADPRALVLALTADQDRFTDGLATAQWFGNGWRRRAEAAQALALTMLDAPATS